MEQQYAAALAEFTHSACDRFAYVKRFLASRDIAFGLIPAGEDRFIHVVIGGASGERPIVTRPIFTAHVDRAPGTPGANDNGAAVLQLLFFAEERARARTGPACEILFTDKEEAGMASSPRNQGSFRLAEILKKRNFSSRVFFNFDMCGRGDMIIISEAGERLLERRKKSGTALYRVLHALRLFYLDKLAPEFQGGLMSLVTPFSDNLGFLLQGFPALQFTLLPRREAVAYARGHRALTSDIASAPRPTRPTVENYKQRFSEIQPETWRLRHTPEDGIASLSPEAFPIMRKLFMLLIRFGVPEDPFIPSFLAGHGRG